MSKTAVGLAVAFTIVLGLSMAGDALAQEKPQFKLGFKALADQIPQVAGEPTENEHHNPANGDALQQTTTGLMVWRKADNWTAFTNGSMTWINGPNGVQSRYNHQRFEWERDSAPSPLPDPEASPGLVLYRADALGGLSDWPLAGGWRVVDGMLVDDGSTQSLSIYAPFQLPAGLADYAVEAEIQLLSIAQYRAFGLLARDGYVGGISTWNWQGHRRAYLGIGGRELGNRIFNPLGEWHSYRVEVRGNQLRLLIDGNLMVELTNNQYLSPGRVGMWNNGGQLSVRSFQVVSLQ